MKLFWNHFWLVVLPSQLCCLCLWAPPPPGCFCFSIPGCFCFSTPPCFDCFCISTTSLGFFEGSQGLHIHPLLYSWRQNTKKWILKTRMMRFLDWKLPWKETPVLVGREEEGSISGQSYTVGHSSQLCENILNPKFEKKSSNKNLQKINLDMNFTFCLMCTFRKKHRLWDWGSRGRGENPKFVLLKKKGVIVFARWPKKDFKALGAYAHNDLSNWLLPWQSRCGDLWGRQVIHRMADHWNPVYIS